MKDLFLGFIIGLLLFYFLQAEYIFSTSKIKQIKCPNVKIKIMER
jgi:hypothetical protein